ncbi:MAG: DUF2442 domain-containing protein [Gammaproteobacteria bacterium]|nr:MAG: DUF2442 domain-containing protein [Gammaproteobacteria bacterium]RKZ74739.1 MAG: DUF2442 domain-containing protein [Gammaproteobacteria bacterium]
MYFTVINVEPLKNYRLLLTFEGEKKRIFNLLPYLQIGQFSKLKDISLFNRVRVSFDSIQWDNHLDIDPELLFEESQPIDL